jgi:glycosyltransferase involved in cell wall biosynthesis
LNLPPREEIKSKYKIITPYAVVMTASFTPNKNYDLFYRIAEHITRIRDDVTFIGVGGYNESKVEFDRLVSLSQNNARILFPGRINDVEALVNACNIGVLFSPNGEGISNAILEYMALGKPVIANDTGGNKEIIFHNQNGYLVINPEEEGITGLILDLINDQQKCHFFGENSKHVIESHFTLEKMGKAFERIYEEALDREKLNPPNQHQQLIIKKEDLLLQEIKK